MAAILFVAAFLFSCNQKNKNVPDAISQPKKPKIEVKYIGHVLTRRTFAEIQFIRNKKERDRYEARQERSNPEVCAYFSKEDSLLVGQFERLGIIKNGEFLQKKFKPQTAPETEFIDASGRYIHTKFFNSLQMDHVHFKFYYKNDSLDIDTDIYPLQNQNLHYTFLDVISGGNKELVFLDECYIMNGYNFNLKVYQIDIQP